MSTLQNAEPKYVSRINECRRLRRVLTEVNCDKDDLSLFITNIEPAITFVCLSQDGLLDSVPADGTVSVV